MISPNSRHAHVIGVGLIGGSIALALRARGWRVTGEDRNESVVTEARSAGLLDEGGLEVATVLVVIATPAGTVLEVAREVLAGASSPELIVTDVAGVKGAIVGGLEDPRFLGGHPMAGSEQRGWRAARADMFRGCTWVLTPTDHTRPATYTRLHGILRELGANVVAIAAGDHDRLVALASHVPHLLAGALMNEAAEAAEQDAVLLQLAAGGFRDMTRIAAGDASIWPDVLIENREAVVATLDSLEERLRRLRDAISTSQRAAIADTLHDASHARRMLPGRALNAENLTYLRVGVSDQPGELARVTRAASELLVNIYDIEIAHGIEGVSGTLLLAVDAEQAHRLIEELVSQGFVVAEET